MKAAIFAKLPVHLWRTGILKLSPAAVFRIFAAWRSCPGSLAFLAEAAAVRSPSVVALCDDEGPMTFSALHDAWESLAFRLCGEFRLGPGRQVVLVGRNDRSFVIGLLAAVRTGADVLLANPGSPPKLLDELLSSHRVDLVLHGEDQVLGAGAQELSRLPLAPALWAMKGGPLCLPKLRAPGRLAVLTSGTTARAKRVNRRPRLGEVLPAMMGLLEALPITVGAPTVLAVPLFHGHGLATLAIALAFAAPLYTGRKYEVAPLLLRCPAAARPIVVSVPTLLLRWLETAPLR
ncbi:MAG: AMP-binding protein, partial [Chthoniobacterales bacterium]